YERVNQSSAVAKIDPEKITTYELAADQDLGSILRASASLYYNQIEGLIGIAQSGRYENLANADSKGVELSLQGQTPEGFSGRISYALQRTESKETRRDLDNSPQHLVKVNCSAPLI